MRSFKSNENIHKKEGGSYYVVLANKATSATSFDVCKVKSGAKKTYDQIQCVLCTAWFHEICVGIKKEDPIGV